jgi:hypothetical protein
MLANNPLDYAHSSAGFYFEGKQGAYQVESWLDWDETKKDNQINDCPSGCSTSTKFIELFCERFEVNSNSILTSLTCFNNLK